MVSLEPTDDGLHLVGSILWFDSASMGQLSFLSSALKVVDYKGPQFLATEETLKLLEAFHKRPKALVCQYNRPFAIGKLKMELIPSGVMLGAALLLIENEGERILYVPSIQTKKLSTVRQAQLVNADILVLGADRPFSNAQIPSRKKEMERLLFAIRKEISARRFPMVICRSTGTAQELTKFLCENDIPLAIHNSINRINEIYEAYNSPLGFYSCYSRKFPKGKVLLYPLHEASARYKNKMTYPDIPILYVEDNMGERFDGDFSLHISEKFYIESMNHGRELKEVVAKVSPKTLYVSGTYAKQYVHELKGSAPVVTALFPNHQPTLF